MRTKITLFLARHKRRFAPFFYPKKIPGSIVIPKNFSQYVNILSQDGVYGRALEITAAAEIWSLGVWVFDKTKKLHSVWDELNETFVSLRYTLRFKHYKLIETLGNLAYQVLQLNKNRRRKMLIEKPIAIDLSTPVVSIQSISLDLNNGLETIKRLNTPKATGYCDGLESFTQNIKHFPIPHHNTLLWKNFNKLQPENKKNIANLFPSFQPLHFERTEMFLCISKGTDLHEMPDDVILSRIKNLKGKKQRMVFNLVRSRK